MALTATHGSPSASENDASEGGLSDALAAELEAELARGSSLERNEEAGNGSTEPLAVIDESTCVELTPDSPERALHSGLQGTHPAVSTGLCVSPSKEQIVFDRSNTNSE